MNRINYIFVDFESVQEINLGLVVGKPVKVLLFLGPQQHKVSVELMKQALDVREQVELVQMECAGKNALDFVIAHHTGRYAALDPDGYFHILSRDKGFDALISHLQSRSFRAARAEVFCRIPILEDLRSLPLTVRVDRVKERLVTMKKPGNEGRPARVKSLCAMIHSIFYKQLTDEDVNEVVAGLKKNRWIGVSDCNKVSYQF